MSLWMRVSKMSVFNGAACGRVLLTSTMLMLAVSARPALAESPATTLATLLDRAQIEDMLVEYYAKMGHGDVKTDFGSYYTDDGIMDVNGVESRGKKAIEAMYVTLGQPLYVPRGGVNMLITNPKIVVNGDTATADTVWTEIVSDSVKTAPRLLRQGREHDELVKRDGNWLFKHRWITSDAGLEPMFDKTYKKR
jgi:ketosteroid isomerase-like protein